MNFSFIFLHWNGSWNSSNFICSTWRFSFIYSLKRLHLQHNQIRTVPFLKVLQGRQIVQEFSKTALKRKKNSTSSLCIKKINDTSFIFVRWFSASNSTNYFQHGLNTNSDVLIKSTIFEEDEDDVSVTMNLNQTSDEEDVSLPAFPELQYLDLSHNLVRFDRDRLNEKKTQRCFFRSIENLFRSKKRTTSWLLPRGQV